ncbi:MAG: ABC transporter permease [Planctomycetota bacterium]
MHAHAVIAIASREVLGWIRQPARIVGTLGTPLLVWLFFAGGFSEMLPLDDSTSSKRWLLGSAAMLVVVFASIFASIGFIKDREDGLIDMTRASPAPAWAPIVGRLAAHALLATTQALLVLVLGGLVVGGVGFLGLVSALVVLAVLSAGVQAFGLLAASRVSSVSGFHGIMNLVIAPAWLLSGSLFPAESADLWLRVAVLVNPLHWAHVVLCASSSLDAGSPLPLPIAALGLVAFGGAMVWLAARERSQR